MAPGEKWIYESGLHPGGLADHLLDALEKQGTVLLGPACSDPEIRPQSVSHPATESGPVPCSPLYGFGPAGSALLFANPVETITCSSTKDLVPFFSRLEAALNAGFFTAGWFSYEFGALLEPRLRQKIFSDIPSAPDSEARFIQKARGCPAPLAWLGLYESCQVLDRASFLSACNRISEDFFQSRWCREGNEPEISFPISSQEFCQAIEDIHNLIRAGDTYQVNYTISGEFAVYCNPASLFFHLWQRQPVSFSAYVNNAPYRILSLSPELFFRLDNGWLSSMPMKGTAPRGSAPDEDRHIRKTLKNDMKNRAENVMIVDLIRNDLGRISETGSVHVPELFRIEEYETLFQMVSLVQGRLRADTGWQQIFQALFPCGSITGAPKIRTMEIISDLEKGPRGIYTGAMGYIAPYGSNAVFNVAIRTLEFIKNQGRIGVGAGITIDSKPEMELEETLLKARFLSSQLKMLQKRKRDCCLIRGRAG